MTDEELDTLVERLIAHKHWGMTEEAATAITTLSAQLAEALAEISRLTDLNSTAYIDGHDAAKNEYRAEIQRLETLNAQLMVMAGEDAVEQIEAAVAVQIEADAGIAWSYIPGEHEGGKISGHVTGMQILEAIRAQSHSRTALDAVRQAAKVEAWREAADAVNGGRRYSLMRSLPPGLREDRNGRYLVADEAYRRILALIEREGM